MCERTLRAELLPRAAMILKAALLTTVAWVRERALFRARASGARDEADRRRTEERFRLAVESSPSGMVMVDAGGTIMLVNAETERLFGYKIGRASCGERG